MPRDTSDETPAAVCGGERPGEGRLLLAGSVPGTPTLWMCTAWLEAPVP